MSHQCLSAGGLIQTIGDFVHPIVYVEQSPMPFGWGANPNGRRLGSIRCVPPESPMPFGWGANPNGARHGSGDSPRPLGHQCLSAGGLIQTEGRDVTKEQKKRAVTNAFRLGG